MDNINRNFGYGAHEMEFSDRFISPDSIPNFSAALLQNSHLNYMQQRNLSREAIFGHQSSPDVQSNTASFPSSHRYPSVTLPGSTNSGLSSLSNQSTDIVSSNPSSGSTQTLPHISGFINSSLPLFRPPVSLPEVTSRQNDSRALAGFSSIIASAASHISTMDIPPPPLIDVAGRQTSSPCLQQPAVPPSGFPPGIPHGPRLNFLNPGHPQHPLPPISTSRLHNQDLNNFPHIPHINLMSSYLDDATASRSSSGTSLSNSISRQSELSFPFRHLQTDDSITGMANLDGDQQVPNAVMSPASGCSSPSVRNAATPFIPQNVIPYPPRNANIPDTESALRNELTFADSTFVDSELCKSLDAENSNMTSSQDSQSEPRCLTNSDRRSSELMASTSLQHQQNQPSTSSVIKETSSVTSLHTGNIEQANAAQYSDVHHKKTISPAKISPLKHSSDDFDGQRAGPSSRNIDITNDRVRGYDQNNMVVDHNVSPLKDAESKPEHLREPSLVPFVKLGTMSCKNRTSFPLINLNKPPRDLNTTDVGTNELDEWQFDLFEYYDMRRRYLTNFYLNSENRNVIVESNPILDSAISCLDENELNGIDFEREESGAKRRKGRRPFFHLKNDENKELRNEEVYNGEYPMKTGDNIETSLNYSGEDPFSDKISLQRQFAITSPSFNKAAAKAVKTTTVADNATLVTVSIMNKLAGKKGKTKSINVNQGNISFPGVNNLTNEDDSLREKSDQVNSDQSAVNTSGLLDGGATEGGQNRELGVDKLSIMSKLKREKDESVTELDRMDFNVRIDDSQLIQHGDQKRWQCLLCPKSYTTKHNLVTHVLDHNGIKPHLCMVCGKYFKQLSHLNTHMLTHDQLKPHVCSVCGKGFTQISHLKRHQAVHLEAKPYICDICNRGFAYPSELRAHKDKHAQGKDRCEDCNEDFDSPQALKLHLMTHENKDELICKYCNKVFRYPSQLKDHILSHNGTRPYICTECGMDFMKEHHLKAHQFTHTGLKPYECPECGRSFNQKANMQRHMLIHNATRAFKCDECGKTFTQPQTLKAHKVVHFETKPHQCTICGKQFGRLHNLQGHLHMHNNTKPYICFCGSSFTLKGNLNRHKKVKHGLNESTESMEEEAVNFLNTLSERARTSLDDDIEEENTSFDLIDPDDSEAQSSSALDAKSPRKGRKSVPRKISVHSANSDEEEEEEAEDDDEYENEQEETTDKNKNVSQYFKSNDKNKDKDGDNNSKETKVKNNKKDSEEKEKIKLAKIKSLRKRKAKDAVLDLPEDEDSEKEDGIKKEEEDDAEWTPIQAKRRKSGKAAKLDSIIEQKFKKS